MVEQAWYLDTPICSFRNLFLQWEQLNGLSLVWVCSSCLISAALMNLFSWLELLCWIVFIWTFVPLHSICRSDPNYDNNDKFSQMQATWWTRLDVKIPSFCLFMNIFLQWKQLNSLSWCELVHTESILLHQRISFHNMNSWMVFISTFQQLFPLWKEIHRSSSIEWRWTQLTQVTNHTAVPIVERDS